MKQGERPSDGLKLEFVAWLMDPHRKGTMGNWADEHDIKRQTLTKWKSQDDVLEMIKRWRDFYQPIFIEGVRTMAKIATDEEHPLVVQAFRTLADLMGEFAPKKVDVNMTVQSLLMQASAVSAVELEDERPIIAIAASSES